MPLKNQYEVIIVGYGPLGQFCALLLSRLGIRTAIIERHKGINPLPRASVVDDQSLRLMNVIEVYEKIKNLFNTP
jgi:3-(3-hydroxy-phenyl)propionate hydroxylase